MTLTVEDFDNIAWLETLEESKKKECYAYSSLFFSKAREAEEKGDTISTDAFRLLANVTSMMLKLDSKSEPYSPVLVTHEARSAIIDDFDENQLDILEKLIDRTSDPEIRARIGDVLWLRRRNYQKAEIAIQSYIDSANGLEDPEHWTSCVERVERALHLSLSLGGNVSHRDRILSHIENMLDKYNGEDPLFLSNRLMELLIGQRHGDPTKYSSLAEKLAKQAEGEKNHRRARIHWETKARWCSLGNLEESRTAALIEAAETYVEEAEAAPGFMAKTTFLQQAIQAFRNIGGMTTRIDELHKLLLDYQQKSMDEMQSFSTEINLGDQIESAIKKVEGKSFREAITILSLMITPPKVDYLRNQVKESFEKHPLQHLFSGVTVNEQGKVTGNIPSMISSDPDDIEQATIANMFKQASFFHTISVMGIIEPVRHQINKEHSIRIHDFHSIVSNNPFVPQGREHLYAQGLHAGFEGDFIVAAHLLIPQFENSIRHILQELGLPTSGVDSQGVQDERSLNTTLYMDKVSEVFGDDVVFDLRGILVERFGANLRNRLAHGLISYNSFFSYEVVYFWWHILRLCCIPLIHEMFPNKDQE